MSNKNLQNLYIREQNETRNKAADQNNQNQAVSKSPFSKGVPPKLLRIE